MITDRHPEWPEFKRILLVAEIEALRDMLEQPLSELETATLRGSIRALRKIIAEVEPSGIDAPARNYSS